MSYSESPSSSTSWKRLGRRLTSPTLTVRNCFMPGITLACLLNFAVAERPDLKMLTFPPSLATSMTFSAESCDEIPFTSTMYDG